MAATFLNVDLQIEAPHSLDHVCCELVEGGAWRLYNGESQGGYLANLEINDGRSGSDPNSIITTFCGIIDGFDERAKSDWSRAHRRTFDLGYETDSEPGPFHSDLKNEVVARVALLGADIRITLYPRPAPEEIQSEQAAPSNGG